MHSLPGELAQDDCRSLLKRNNQTVSPTWRGSELKGALLLR
jgi:hypothetical protein